MKAVQVSLQKVFYRVRETLQHGTNICLKCSMKHADTTNIFIKWSCFSFTCLLCRDISRHASALYSFFLFLLKPLLPYTNHPIQVFFAYTTPHSSLSLLKFSQGAREVVIPHTVEFFCLFFESSKVFESHVAGCFILK